MRERRTRVSISGVAQTTPGMSLSLRASSSSPETTFDDVPTMETCGLKSSIFFSQMSPKPVMTLRTMTTAATPSMTPITETQAIAEATERFGFRYLRARNVVKLNAGDPQMSTSTPTSSPLSTAASSLSNEFSSAAFVCVVGR